VVLAVRSDEKVIRTSEVDWLEVIVAESVIVAV